jgi:thiol-disulfide isomerase/thioredoxin
MTSREKNKSLWITVLVPVIAIVAACFVALKYMHYRMNTSAVVEESSEDFTLTEGAILPDFSLTRLEGGTVPVSQLNYKVLLINFWATWCAPCIVEIPSIVKLKEKFGPKGLEIAAISVDENPQELVPKAAKRLRMNFPIFLDPDSDLADLFEVHAIPLTAIIDKNRKILLLEPGERDWMHESIQQKVENWLK